MRDTASYSASFAASESDSLLDGLTDEQRQRLIDVLDGYLRSLESGMPPNEEQLIEQHPDLAEPLQAYLRNLLELHDAAAAFGRDMPQPSAAAADDDGKRLGDFVLLGELGRGGMGVVYEARQISLSRRVALKVLPFAAVLDAQQIARFKNEAQAAAQLHHPSIVPVYAVGSERGVHYYAMQLVDGQSLDRAIGELRAAADAEQHSLAHGRDERAAERRDVCAVTAAWSGGGSLLSGHWADRPEYFRTVVRLVIQAAEALHAAHAEGVVHRDVKPSNLMLDSTGKLWVTDFGLARCQSGMDLTRTGDVVGTRQYMSPEQALGEAALVDQRTDVYSLGATLYELLTLRPAFDGDDAATLLRHIEQHEPIRPRQLQPLIPADLETVVQKAMARGRDERYQTAAELAEDLRRVLDGQPTIARPPTPLERLGKWARRHRRVVAASGAIGLVALVGFMFATLLIHREKTKALSDYARAERYFRQAQHTVDLFGSRVAQRLADVPGAEGVRRELLAETLRYYQQFIEQAGDDPSLRSELATTYSKIGTLNDELGLTDEAIAAHESAITLLGELAGEAPHDVDYAQRLAVGYNNLALALGRAGRGNDARAAFGQAIAGQRQLLDQQPDDRQLRSELAVSFSNLGTLERDAGAIDKARAAFGEAIRVIEPLAEQPPDDPAMLRGMAAAYNNLAALDASDDQAQAETLYEQAAAYQRLAMKSRPGDRAYRSDLAATLNNLGAAQSRAGQFEQAAQTYRDAIELQKDLVRLVPLDRGYRRDLAVSYNNLGLACTRLGRSSVAERCFNNALGFSKQLLAERPNDTGMQSSVGGIYNNLGIVLEKERRYDAAADSFAQAIEHQQLAYTNRPEAPRYRTFLSKHYYNYGRLLRRLGRADAAEQAALERKALWPGDPDRLLSVAEELALAGKLAQRATASSPTAESCADLAVATLREAVEAGLQLPDDLDRRGAFSAIQGRPDFLELVK